VRVIPSLRLWMMVASIASVAFFASGDAYGAPPTVGSANTATADPPVARPNTQPCVVSLFNQVTFADFSPKSFSYAPPADCPGPWAKVVFEADLQVTAGRQFDRTANVWIGAANVYFGTTAEPSRTVSRSWHVERDLTDYGALLSSPQAGEADLGNLVNETFTSILTGSAHILFYPLPRGGRAGLGEPKRPDIVLPLSAGPTGGVAQLDTGVSRLARTFQMPTNVERAYLDVIAQSQSADEFWYTCVPSDVATELQSCGGGSFRETEIFIDGKPAGIAPVYPWIYTGGIDPYLWRPIPGVQTLNFVPYRVDLTPFAGVFSDGQPHEVAIGVYGANGFFAATGTLLLYLDHGAQRVKGQVTTNTLAADPAPQVLENLQNAGGSVTGTVSVRAARQFILAGYVDTSRGRVRTEIVQSIDFSNEQRFDVSASKYVQSITQSTRIASLTNTQGRGASTQIWTGKDWPLRVDFSFVTKPDNTSEQVTTIDQRFGSGELVTENGIPRVSRTLSNAVASTDALEFDATGAVIGPQDPTSSQRYLERDLFGACYSRTLASAGGLLTRVTDGQECGGAARP